MILKFSKFFESIDLDEIVFSLTKDDILDMLLPFTDEGFKIKIYEMFVDTNYNDLDGPNSNINGYKTDQLQIGISSKIKQNEILGAYQINISRDKNESETKLFKNTISDLKTYQLIINEILQISKRCDYLEWNINSDHHEEILEVEIFLVCPKKELKSKDKNNFLGDKYKSNLNSIKYSRINKVLKLIRDKITTKLLEESLSVFFIGSAHEKTIDNGEIFIFFKDVPQKYITINQNKLNNLEFNLGGVKKLPEQTIKIYDVEQLKNKSIIIEKAKYVMEIKFNYQKFMNSIKKDLKLRF